MIQSIEFSAQDRIAVTATLPFGIMSCLALSEVMFHQKTISVRSECSRKNEGPESHVRWCSPQ